MNKKIHTLTTFTIIIELSGWGTGRWYERCGGWNKNTTSLQYSITRGFGNRRGRRKTRVVSPLMGQAGCPGREARLSEACGTMGGSQRVKFKNGAVNSVKVGFSNTQVLWGNWVASCVAALQTKTQKKCHAAVSRAETSLRQKPRKSRHNSQIFTLFIIPLSYT